MKKDAGAVFSNNSNDNEDVKNENDNDDDDGDDNDVDDDGGSNNIDNKGCWMKKMLQTQGLEEKRESDAQKDSKIKKSSL